MKRYFIIMPALVLALAAGCINESPTVIPDPASQTFTGTSSGTVKPQLTGMYPESLDSNIPVDADIVLVFSKPIDTSTVTPATVSISDGVNSVTAFTVTSASGGRTIIIDITATSPVTAPAALVNNSTYTVSLTTGITDTEATPNNLDAASSWTFTTASSTALAEEPRVIAGTQYPTGTGVSINVPYAEATFTRDMTDATITTGSFWSDTGIDVGITKISSKTYRLDFNPAFKLGYGATHWVYMTAAVTDNDIPPNALIVDAAASWTFDTETNPVPGAKTISSVWIESVSATGAVVSFSTSKPVARQDCYVLYDTVPVTLASTAVKEFADATLTTVHTVTIPGPLSPSTRYYIQAGLDTDSNGTVDYQSGTNIIIYTKTDGTVNHGVSAAAGTQNGLAVVQNDNGTGYAFWVDGGKNIYGEYFQSTTTPAGVWGVGGIKVNSAVDATKVIAINNGFSDAIVIYQEDITNILYARDVYNITVPPDTLAQRWAEASLGITVKAGSSFSACLVHERPSIITSGIADMPNNGTAANLLYDRDVDFSGIAFLDVNDIIAIDNAGIIWAEGTINNQTASPFDIFNYVLWSTVATNLGAVVNYYILDADVTVTGTADSISTATEIRSSITNLSTIKAGYIVRTSDGEWGKTSAGAWNAVPPYWYVTIDRSLTSFADGKAFTIYIDPSGPHTSQAVTNPLWDKVPSVPFNPGTTVQTGDRIVNENTNAAAATSATVAATDLTRDTDYALRLSGDIMDDGHIYSIVRLPSGATYSAVGYSTNVATNYNLTDSNIPAPFGAVTLGDIVYNIDSNLSAMVTASAVGSLTLTADIFNAINDKAIVYTKRGFLVAYIDINDFVLARSFNMADGTPLGAAFAVHAAGVNNNPMAVSDGAGNAIVFYERGGDIFATKVSATGTVLFVEATILNTALSQTILQVLPDRATAGVGGAYVLADDGSGTVTILRVNGSTGGVTWSQNFPGYDPHMLADTDVPNPNRVLITYRNTHVAGGGTYYHIEARAYSSGGALVVPAFNVSNNAAQYHCDLPRIALADTGTGASGFYVSWFDGRYISYIGYSLYAKRFLSGGGSDVGFYSGNERFITSPGSSGYLNVIGLGLLTWDDNVVAAPYGIIPIWLDYRAALPANQPDIYYENIADDGNF